MFILPKEVLIKEDGIEYQSEQIISWVNQAKLEKAQLIYKNEQLKIQNAEYESALTEIEKALEV